MAARRTVPNSSFRSCGASAASAPRASACSNARSASRHFERNVANAVAVAANVLGGRMRRSQRRAHDKSCLALGQRVGGHLPAARLLSAVGHLRKSECVAVEERGLSGIANPEFHVMNALDLQRIFHLPHPASPATSDIRVRAHQPNPASCEPAPRPSAPCCWMTENGMKLQAIRRPAVHGNPMNSSSGRGVRKYCYSADFPEMCSEVTKDCDFGPWKMEPKRVTIDLVLKMVFNFMKVPATKPNHTLCDLAVGESGILEDFDMPQSIAEHLMNLGFVPGLEVLVARSGPGGNPRVYRVDGTEVALRRDLSRCIAVRPLRDAEAEMR